NAVALPDTCRRIRRPLPGIRASLASRSVAFFQKPADLLIKTFESKLRCLRIAIAHPLSLQGSEFGSARTVIASATKQSSFARYDKAGLLRQSPSETGVFRRPMVRNDGGGEQLLRIAIFL